MIKLDIDMPTECRLCPIYNGEFGECQLRQQFPSRFNDVHALFDKRPHNCPLVEDVSEDVGKAFDVAIEALKKERPHGKWIKKVDDVNFVSHICSECGFELELEDCSDSYYCANCGADMREATDNEN